MLVCLLGHPQCRTLCLCSPENGKRGWGEVTPCVTLLKAWNWSTNGRYWKLKLNLVLTQLNANQGTGHTICEKPARASCVIFHQCSVNMTTFLMLRIFIPNTERQRTLGHCFLHSQRAMKWTGWMFVWCFSVIYIFPRPFNIVYGPCLFYTKWYHDHYVFTKSYSWNFITTSFGSI